MFVAVPIRIDDKRRFRVRPVANGVLIVLNVLALLVPSSRWFLADDSPWWTVFTYGFVHANPWHLMGNLYVLAVVGNAVNRRVGNVNYLCAWFGTLIAMGVVGKLLGLGPIGGSSGAIFAIVAMLLMLMPAAVVELAYASLLPMTLIIGCLAPPNDFVGWFIRWGNVRARAWWCFVLVPLMELWSLLWWRYSLGDWQWTHPAHLLGFVCGIAVVLLLPTRVTIGSHAS